MDDEFLDRDAFEETGSDELLSEDTLRLPDSASILVRIHAVRAWLARRRRESEREVGEVGLASQHLMRAAPATRMRRRERQYQEEQQRACEHALAATQARLSVYEEAQSLFEDCVAHTGGERVLVEYYLALDDLAQAEMEKTVQSEPSLRLQVLAEVQYHLEHVGAPQEEDM